MYTSTYAPSLAIGDSLVNPSTSRLAPGTQRLLASARLNSPGLLTVRHDSMVSTPRARPGKTRLPTRPDCSASEVRLPGDRTTSTPLVLRAQQSRPEGTSRTAPSRHIQPTAAKRAGSNPSQRANLRSCPSTTTTRLAPIVTATARPESPRLSVSGIAPLGLALF
jgi:hypothetical protein